MKLPWKDKARLLCVCVGEKGREIEQTCVCVIVETILENTAHLVCVRVCVCEREKEGGCMILFVCLCMCVRCVWVGGWVSVDSYVSPLHGGL